MITLAKDDYRKGRGLSLREPIKSLARVGGSSQAKELQHVVTRFGALGFFKGTPSTYHNPFFQSHDEG